MKISYQNKTYPSVSALHAALKPNVSIILLRQRISILRKRGMDDEQAIKSALKSKPRFTGKIKCITCKKTKSQSKYTPHATSHTGFKTECNACKKTVVTEQSNDYTWARITGSMPLGNVPPLKDGALNRLSGAV